VVDKYVGFWFGVGFDIAVMDGVLTENNTITAGCRSGMEIAHYNVELHLDCAVGGEVLKERYQSYQ